MVYVWPFSLKGTCQVGTKVLLSRGRVSASHKLGHGRWGWDARQAGCLLPPTRLHDIREQIPKWHLEVLKGNLEVLKGNMPPIDQSMGIQGGEQGQIIKAKA